jgi:hypothetical protein
MTPHVPKPRGGLTDKRLALMVLVTAVTLSALTLMVGFNPPDADIKYDWLVTREATRGDGDAYQDVLQLGRDEGVNVVVHAGVGVDEFTGHPRPPGAIVLQLPLVLIPFELLFAASIFLSTVATAVVALVVDRKRNPKAGLITVGSLLLAAPVWINFRYAGQAAVVAALALVGWLLVRDRDGVLGGVLIGLASVLKLFPALLIVPLLLTKRWRASLSLVGTGVVLNLIGLALPGVSAGAALRELAVATNTWVTLPSNGSFVKQFVSAGLPSSVAQVVAVAVVALLLAVLIRQSRLAGRRIGVIPFSWLAAGLLVLPLSWISYDLVLAPAVILMVMSPERRYRLLGLVGIGLWVTPTIIWTHGTLLEAPVSLWVRVLVLVISFQVLDENEAWSLRADSSQTDAYALNLGSP